MVVVLARRRDRRFMWVISRSVRASERRRRSAETIAKPGFGAANDSCTTADHPQSSAVAHANRRGGSTVRTDVNVDDHLTSVYSPSSTVVVRWTQDATGPSATTWTGRAHDVSSMTRPRVPGEGTPDGSLAQYSRKVSATPVSATHH